MQDYAAGMGACSIRTCQFLSYPPGIGGSGIPLVGGLLQSKKNMNKMPHISIAVVVATYLL